MKFVRLCLIFTLVCSPLLAREWPSYYNRSAFLYGSAGSFENGLVGFIQPANLNFIHNFEGRFYWNDQTNNRDWGIFTGVKGLGFGVYRHQDQNGFKAQDFRVSSGFGSEGMALGIGYGWTSGDRQLTGYGKLLTTGLISRPNSYLSIGLLGNWSLENGGKEGVAELGVRPLGTSQLTLFADAALQDKMKISDAWWSTGAAVKILDGMYLTGRYFDREMFTFGITLNLGELGVGSQFHYDRDQKYDHNSYMIRIGGMQPGFLQTLIRKDRMVLKKNLRGAIGYHKYVFFDDRTHPLYEILKDMRAASEDPRVKVIALNLSSSSMLPEHAWEIRKTVLESQQTGKKIVVFLDRAGMTAYHLASVADLIVLDPEGQLELPGYLLGKTYFKGTLEKLGIGFDEWRFFKYKSATEVLIRDDMSAADREQYEAYLNDWYETVRTDICSSRGFSENEFDRLIDSVVFLTPNQAIKEGLIDTLGRWTDADNIIEQFSGRNLSTISSPKLLKNALPFQKWGFKPKIAVVYALGECAMDEGIHARWLDRIFRKLEKDHEVKAVVFRVDSPGGDGMASDVVAQAVRECRKKKPVIVTQGQVAGSGGYWISVYGSRILAAPNTITGSIGVIGGWVYDKGFSDKLGMTSDFVKRGAHADLGYGIGMAGLRLPSRNLDKQEQKRVEEIILEYYENFIGIVAEGRNMAPEKVKSIAQGRFYSGLDGRQNGLIDNIGNLLDALEEAEKAAGLKPGDEIEIIQYPENKGLINLEGIVRQAESPVEASSVYRYLKMVSDHPAEPLPMMIPGTYPEIDQ